MTLKLSQIIKDYRASRKLTQLDLSNALGISIKTLHNWEQGRCEPKGLAKLTLLNYLTK